jgi:sigma-B regulation protein RsbU (phosphoserine phosphatase)
MFRKVIEANHSLLLSQILIVDDSELSRKISEKLLVDEGFKNIISAENGVEALKVLESNSPSIIICDLHMPEMDGYSFIKTIRELERFKSTPVIIQTATSDPEDINKAYKNNANDLVAKPIQKYEFLSKIVFHLENYIYRSRVMSELNEAKLMQESIIPNKESVKEIEEGYKVDIATYFSPSSEVGGDFWGLKRVSLNEFAMFNVDLSGHGLAAALNTFRVSSLIEDRSNVFSSPDIILKKINKRLKEFMPTGQFATIFYAVIDIENKTLKYSGAGCPPPILLKANGETVEIDTKGIPLGITKDAIYEENTIKLEKNDTLVSFSDALTETENDHGEFFTHNRLKKILSKCNGLDADDILDKVLDKFNGFIEQGSGCRVKL